MPANEVVLSQVAREVFEQLVFLPLQYEFAQTSPGRFVSASISFAGKMDGTLILKIPEKYISKLFCSMLGLEDESGPVPPDQARDAVCELLNILGGNLLTRLTDSQTSFDMGTPQLLPAEETPAPVDGMQPISVRLGLFEDWIELILAVKKGSLKQ